MVITFEHDVLKFLAQQREGKRFLKGKVIDGALFDQPEHQMILKLMKGYTKEYPSSQLSESGLLQYFERSRKTSKQQLDKAVVEILESTIKMCYKPIGADIQHIRKTLIEYMQFKRAKLMLANYYDRIGEGVTVFQEMRNEMTKILRMEEDALGRITGSGFLLKDFEHPTHDGSEVYPCHYHGLNDLTAIGGFRPPQLIIFLGPQKGFKTGFLINLMVGYLRRGKKVAYIDCENGGRDIRERAYQCMLAITWRELMGMEYRDKLKRMVHLYGGRGADMWVGDYPINKATTVDIEADLDILKDEGWEPDILVVDYVDLLQCTDSKVTEKRFIIQGVYSDIKNLNKRRNLVTFSLSQVNRQALGKRTFNAKDLGEDIGKAANCDACFAICQTNGEKKAKIARLMSVVQRKGAEFTGSEFVYLEVDKARMTVNEVSKEYAVGLIEEAVGGLPAVDAASLDDE